MTLYPIRENGRWGYIDAAGGVTIPPTLAFDHAFPFEGDVARVNVGGGWKEGESLVGGKWGIIDRRGRTLVEPLFGFIGGFDQGVAVVEQEGKHGFIDRAGRMVVEPAFNNWPRFSDGAAWVETGGERVRSPDVSERVDGEPGFHYESRRRGAIDRGLRFLFPPSEFDEVQGFQDGVAWVKTGGRWRQDPAHGAHCEGGKWGLIDKSGAFLVPPRFDEVSGFREGVAWASAGSRWGLLDTRGNVLLEPAFAGVREFTEGVAWVNPAGDILLRTGTWGLVDTAGRMLVEPRFDAVGEFREGAAWTRADGKEGFVDKKGDYILGPMGESLDRHFHRGAVWVYVKGKYMHEYNRGGRPEMQGRYGLMDGSGRWLIEPTFDDAYAFSEDAALVDLNHKKGLVSPRGEYIVKPEFDEVLRRKEAGVVLVKRDKKWGMVSSSGEVLVEPGFDAIEPFDGGAFVYAGATGEWLQAPTGGKWGLIDRRGNLRVPPAFDRVERFAGELARVWVGHRWGYVNKEGTTVWMEK